MGDVARSHARLGTFGIVWLKRTVGSCHTKQPGESWKLKWIQCLRIRNRRPLFCPAGWFPVACKTLAVSWRFFVANVMYAPCTNRKEIIPVKMPVLLLRGRRLRDKMLDAEIAVSQINLAVGTQSLLVTPKLDGDLFSYAYFSKHVADESSFGIRRPQPALCRWNRGLETRTWPSRLFVPAGFMPAERRFDDYGVNPHSGFGHHAINFRGRTLRPRFDTMSSRATTKIHRSEASGEAAMPRWILSFQQLRILRASFCVVM